MKSLLLTLLVFIEALSAETVFIEKAGITLEPPQSWKPHIPDITGLPENICLPRLKKDNYFTIDAVIWRDAASLDDAVDQYVERLQRVSKETKSIRIIDRKPFVSESGIQGIRLQIETSMTRGCGSSVFLLRYVFRNSDNKIVCLGGFGDHSEIDKIVLSTITLK